MTRFVFLARGLNVGGKNKVPMAQLRAVVEGLGCTNVSTYIASGNVLLDSTESAVRIRDRVEAALVGNFPLDDAAVKVLVLSRAQFRKVIDDKPTGFGDHPEEFHSDAIFLMDISLTDAMAVFKPREGVDRVWPGTGVIYSQRLSAERTRSRLGAIVASPLYKSMTIRSWSTTLKLRELLEA